jgi:hypothetical protein
MSDEIELPPDYYAFRAIERLEKKVGALESALIDLLFELTDEKALSKELREKLINIYKED